VKDRQASRTAEGVALIRALESRRPKNVRICYDPLAEHFLGAPFTIVLNSRLIQRLMRRRGERLSPGLIGFVVARCRYIDDRLRVCLDEGIEQLVILGAGYDSRAYRFDELKERIRVFELDYPATQKVKMEKLRKVIPSPQANITYIPVDFNREDFREALFAGGYDKTMKTLFIWEGVTYYVTSEAVDGTVAFVAGNSGIGSSIIFDYIFSRSLDAALQSRQGRRFMRHLRRADEPLLFGIGEDRIEEFLNKRGFSLWEDISGEQLKCKYFKGINQFRTVNDKLAIVHARVQRQA
jgi:methyltransferase (TIGR00027 family)